MGLLDAHGMVGLLRAAERNHDLIANNLANLNTPGYRTGRLRFSQALEAVLDRRSDLLPGKDVETEIYRPMYADASPDGNDVTLSREIVELNKNTLRMQLYLAALGGRIRKMRLAIDGK